MDTGSRFQVLSLDKFIPTVRDYRSRKVHRKTKSGCLTCKEKKVKCDESRPVCLRCRRNSRTCAYQPSIHSRQNSNGSESAADREYTGSFSSLSAVTVLPFSSSSAKNGTSGIHLMQHFHRHCREIFNIRCSDEILSLFVSNSLVRNTILATTACHLRYVSPGVLQHRIAEHFQQSLALKDYQQVLDTPRAELGQSGVNALLLSTAMLNMLSFALPQPEAEAYICSGDVDPTSSWVFSSSDGRLGWLGLQVGLRPLVISMVPYLDQSLKFLSGVFFGPKTGVWPWTFSHRNFDNVPDNWIKIFELDGIPRACDGEIKFPGDFAKARGRINSIHRGIEPSRVFQLPAMVLAQLRNFEPVASNIFTNLQFLGKIQPEFRAMLYARDERALWLLGYWLGLMCRFEDIWWSDQRARRDYTAICMWLEQLHLPERPGSEGERWAEMMEELKLAPTFVRSSCTNTAILSME